MEATKLSIKELVRNKKYKIEIVIGYNGKTKIRHYETFYGKKSEAKVKEFELKAMLKDGSALQLNKLTMRDLSQEYLKFQRDVLSPKTFINYEYRMQLIIEKLGYVKLKELNVTLDDVLSISSRFGENLGMLTNYIIDDKSADAVLGFFSKNRIDVRSIIPYLESQYRDLRYDDKQILNSLAKISSKYNVEDEFLRFGFSLLHDKMTKEEIIDSLITTLKMNGTSEDRANQYKDALYKQLNEYLAEE